MGFLSAAVYNAVVSRTVDVNKRVIGWNLDLVKWNVWLGQSINAFARSGARDTKGTNMHQLTFSALVIAVTGLTAHSDIVRVDEFSSLQFEGFENLNMGVFESAPISVFGGMGEISNTGNSWLHSTSGWSFQSGEWRARADAFEGSRLLGNTRGGIAYEFEESQKSFGGYFATIADSPDGTIKFYNGDQLVGSEILQVAAGGDWAWNGWASDQSFDRVVVDSSYGDNGGFLMHDAVRVLSTAVPTQGTAAIFAFGLVIATKRHRE
ncbi:MAG: hypothetical protein P1U42_03910 [Phycisphaerales bacterium]|nr:hypothetical protein [Phycisphaerales bacterium]